MTGSMAFAFGAGLLATVNPCGFAMLPSFLGVYLRSADDARAGRSLLARSGHGFLVGLVLSGAFSGVLVLAGLVLAVGLRSLVDAAPWLAAAVGTGLMIAGAATLAGRRVALSAASRIRPAGTRRHGYARIAVFGAGYALASLSCTVAVVLAVVGQATATANPIELLAVFAAFAAGATSMLLALTLSLALASGLITRTVRRLLPLVNRLAGGLLVASGAYLILYWLPVLGGGDGAADTAIAQRTRELSSSLQAFFATHSATFAIALAALAVTGAALALVARSRHRPADDQPVGACCEPPAANGSAPRAGERPLVKS